MTTRRQNQRRFVPALMIAAITVLICQSATAQNDVQLGGIYYQVQYADRSVADLPLIPETNKGVKSVLRIATVGSERNAPREARILSTRTGVTSPAELSRTYRTQLVWNSRAWVGSAADRTHRFAKVLSTSDFRIRANRRVRPGRKHPLLESLLQLENRRAFWRLAAIDVEAKMFEHAGTPRAGKKRWDLAAVHVIQRQVDDSIGRHRKALTRLNKQGKLGKRFKLQDYKPVKFGGPTGKVVVSKPDGLWKTAAGIAVPISKPSVPAHRLQVWAAPTERGRRDYHVSMAHAEAGTFGAFYYVAYCDSTGDGLPDTPIARSAMALSARSGQWTEWSFTTNAENVFIGHTWHGADTAIYCQRSSGAGWRQLGRQAFTAQNIDTLPRRVSGPYVSNLRVYSTPAPLAPTTKPAPATP
jgi:hypothetical protein